MNEFDARVLAALERRLEPVGRFVELAAPVLARWAPLFWAYWFVAAGVVAGFTGDVAWSFVSLAAGSAAVLTFLKGC